MPTRQKILILEHDDFLREILGNLLHKQGFYILNGTNIQQGITDAQNQTVQSVILGTSCLDYNGKASLHFITKQFGPNVDIYIINQSTKALPYHPADKQMMVKDLMVSSIIDYFSSKNATV